MLTRTVIHAQGWAQAFAKRNVSNVLGHRGHVWTGTPPDNDGFTASPFGICKTSQCNNWVETGWVKGSIVNNALKQYVSWMDQNGQPHQVFFDSLSENTWYEFQVSSGGGWWWVYRNGNPEWVEPLSWPIGWDVGAHVSSGSEADWFNDWMDVWVWHPHYKQNVGGWTLYNYAFTHTSGGGHVQRAYDFGHHAWGP
jgi:hypothetical protein